MNIIKRIMIIFSISFLIPIIVMVIHLTAYEHNSTVQQYKEKVNSVLTDISKMTDNYMEDLKRYVLENSENPDFKLILFSPFLCPFFSSGSACESVPVYSFTPCLYTEYPDLHPMHPRR